MLASAITPLGKTVLLLVAIVFILWSLYTALVIPKKHPSFPRRLDLYIVLSAALFVAQMTAVVWVTGTQEVEHAEAAAHEVTPATEAEAEGEEPAPAPETSAAAGDPVAGKDVFASAGCGACHMLADAGAAGAVGPNLDESLPTAELVVDRVTHGKGAMPSFADQLTEHQIADVAAYITSTSNEGY